MNIYNSVKRLFLGKKIAVDFAQHRVDIEVPELKMPSLVIRQDIRLAVTSEGFSIRLWGLDGNLSRLITSAEVKNPICFAAADCCSKEWVTMCKTGTNLDSACYLEFRAWDTLSSTRKIHLPKGLVWPQCMAVAPNGGLIAVASYEERLLLFDYSSGEMLDKSQQWNSIISGASFSPDSRLLTAAFTDQGGGDIWMFDVSRGKLEAFAEPLFRGDLSKFDLADSIVGAVYSPNGEYLAIHETYAEGQDEHQQGAVAMYRMPDAKLVWTKILSSNAIAQEFVRLGRIVCCFDTVPEFSADSKILYVGTTGGEVIALSISDGTELARLKMPMNQFIRRVKVDDSENVLWSLDGMKPISVCVDTLYPK